MRILLIGAVEFSHRALLHLVGMGAHVVGVCTLRQSSFNADHVDLSDACRSSGIPSVYADDIHAPELLAWMATHKPDVIFCFGWSRLLKPPVLSLAPMGVVGFHPAALPMNRGRHPLIWALVLGLNKTASTFFFMDEGADSGPILSQREIAILPDDDARSLYDKVVGVALAQITEFVPQLASGVYPKIDQNHALANSWRKRSYPDGKIDWRMSAASIHNLVRGLGRPYVGAEFVVENQSWKVWKARVIDEAPANLEPGKIIGADADGHPIVKCGHGAICLLETEPVFRPAKECYL